MNIKRRQNLLEMFSTFLKIVDSHSYGGITWVTDSKLERNINKSVFLPLNN